MGIQTEVLRETGNRTATGILGASFIIDGTSSAIDPNLTMLDLASLDDQLGNLLAHERLAQLFGILALVVASVGLYGITAYSVAERT